MIPRLLLLTALLCAPAGAQSLPDASPDAPTDGPRLEVSVTPVGPVTVGTPLAVTYTLLVPSFMPQPPVWPDLQLADAITRTVTDGRPVTRRVGTQSWAGVTRSYVITPQSAADYAFPEARVHVTYAGPDSGAPRTFDLPLPPIAFSAVIPKGAEGLDPFVAATALRLTATVEGPGADPKPGAAVVLTLVQEAEGTQAMLLPPLLEHLAVPQGLRAYPHEPETEDRPGQRGAPDTARRVEAVTYVAEAPGDYTLPAARLDWWNADAGRVESAATDPARFRVPAPPGWHPPPTPEEAAARRRRTWALAVLAAMVLAGGWALRGRVAAWRARRAVSEPVLYRRLRRLARRGDLAALRPALAGWLATFGRMEPPEPLARALIAAERDRWGPGPAAGVDGSALVAALETGRAALRAGARGSADPPALPPLNPWKKSRTGPGHALDAVAVTDWR